jgi:hypothetical protein
MSILIKAVLASASGLLCYAVFNFGFDGQWPEILFYSVSGALFASGVLFPYLRRDRFVWYRGFGLIITSSISYWSAIETVLLTVDSKGFPNAISYMAASLVGALIALTGARLISPLNRSMALAAFGFSAAIFGGLAFATLPDDWRGFFPFLIWHCLMAIAVHLAENRKLRTGVAKCSPGD